MDGVLYRRVARRQPCVECGAEVTLRRWIALRRGVPAAIDLVGRGATRCSGCERDEWEARR